MNVLERQLAAASKIMQVADSIRDVSAQISLKECAAVIRGTVATIRAALESEAEKSGRPGKFALFQGDESPLPTAKISKSPSIKKVSK